MRSDSWLEGNGGGGRRSRLVTGGIGRLRRGGGGSARFWFVVVLTAVGEAFGAFALFAAGDAFDGHAAFGAGAAEFFDFVVEFEEAVESGWVETAFGEGGADGAAGVGSVFAVVEAAEGGEFGDVCEAIAERGFVRPHVDLADAWVIDEDASGGEEHEFACGGGVAAFAGDLIDLVGPLVFVAEELVDDGGFADPAGADEGDGDAFFEVLAEDLEGAALFSAGDVDIGVGGESAEGIGGGLVFCGGEEVGFVDEDDGFGSAAADDGEVAFHAALAEVWAGVGDDGDDVDVSGDDLFFGAAAGGFAGETGAAWETGADDAFVAFDVEGDPVADGWEFGVGDGVVVEFSADDGVEFVAVAEESAAGEIVVAEEPCGDEAGFFVRGEGVFEEGIPAEVSERHEEWGSGRVGDGSVGGDGD